MALDEDKLNLSLRSFLKRVGINSQRHIEAALRQAAAEGRLPTRVPVKMSLTLGDMGKALVIEGEIECG
jgi:hypothetical protein